MSLFDNELLSIPMILNRKLIVPRRLGPDPEAALKSRRGYVGPVGVEIVQKGEERTIGRRWRNQPRKASLVPYAPRDWRPIHFIW